MKGVVLLLLGNRNVYGGVLGAFLLGFVELWVSGKYQVNGKMLLPFVLLIVFYDIATTRDFEEIRFIDLISIPNILERVIAYSEQVVHHVFVQGSRVFDPVTNITI